MKATKKQIQDVLTGFNNERLKLISSVTNTQLNFQTHIGKFDFIAITKIDEKLGKKLFIDFLKSHLAEMEIEDQIDDILANLNNNT